MEYATDMCGALLFTQVLPADSVNSSKNSSQHIKHVEKMAGKTNFSKSKETGEQRSASLTTTHCMYNHESGMISQALCCKMHRDFITKPTFKKLSEPISDSKYYGLEHIKGLKWSC
uniref:Uncharacterized protein n=1 Tax=Populus trichocarpa TaxID=3694 RepID=B9H0J4_POPTR